MAEAANDNGNGGLMKYARIVSTLGVPVVLSLFLTYWVTTTVARDMEQGRMDRQLLIEMIRDQNRIMDRNFQNYQVLLHTICLNTSTTDYARQVCHQQQPPNTGPAK
jgi:hypothetical protein